MAALVRQARRARPRRGCRLQYTCQGLLALPHASFERSRSAHRTTFSHPPPPAPHPYASTRPWRWTLLFATAFASLSRSRLRVTLSCSGLCGSTTSLPVFPLASVQPCIFARTDGRPCIDPSSSRVGTFAYSHRAATARARTPVRLRQASEAADADELRRECERLRAALRDNEGQRAAVLRHVTELQHELMLARRQACQHARESDMEEATDGRFEWHPTWKKRSSVNGRRRQRAARAIAVTSVPQCVSTGVPVCTAARLRASTRLRASAFAHVCSRWRLPWRARVPICACLLSAWAKLGATCFAGRGRAVIAAS
eukprot:2400054-Pleurochrysis_carterae.AAC.2